MGFRCPLCSEDFGHDKAAFNAHIAAAHHGAAQTLVDAIRKTVEPLPGAVTAALRTVTEAVWVPHAERPDVEVLRITLECGHMIHRSPRNAPFNLIPTSPAREPLQIHCRQCVSEAMRSSA